MPAIGRLVLLSPEPRVLHFFIRHPSSFILAFPRRRLSGVVIWRQNFGHPFSPQFSKLT
jgi:hypothetical protein